MTTCKIENPIISMFIEWIVQKYLSQKKTYIFGLLEFFNKIVLDNLNISERFNPNQVLLFGEDAKGITQN